MENTANRVWLLWYTMNDKSKALTFWIPLVKDIVGHKLG